MSESVGNRQNANGVELEIQDQLAFIFLARGEGRIPILTLERMESLARALDKVKASPGLRGLIIAGDAEHGFCGGADVKVIEEVVDSAQGEALARRGQEIFSQLSALPIPSVAAMHGAVVGGGCELALACTRRVMIEMDASKIGLPEIKLGIVPGFGGTQRLPRLIGLPKAFDVILKGKTITARQAKKYGLVDLLIPEVVGNFSENFSRLLVAARQAALGEIALSANKLSFADSFLSFTGLGRAIVRRKALAEVRKETKGHYPAPVRAVEVACLGLAEGIEAGLGAEAKALGEMIVTSQCKALVHLYFLAENAAKIGKLYREEVRKADVAILGAGVMGVGIASVFLLKGFSVVLIDPVEAARRKAREQLERVVAGRHYLSEEQRRELLSRLRITEELGQIARAELLIEAIVEDLKVKVEILRAAETILPAEAILASNTSSLSINEIASGLSHPERVIGMHFFNPAEKMPLVEIIRGDKTSDRTLAFVAAMTSAINKYPVIVEDVPGFLVNRMLAIYIAEAAELLAEGYAVPDIDSSASNFGMPMGPFRMLDEVGLDIAQKVQHGLTAYYGPRAQAPEFARMLVEQGKLGRKSGLGFYQYQQQSTVLNEGIYRALQLPQERRQADPGLIIDRLILALVNEAVRCLDERVAGVPGAESAGQIDLASVMGMGFPPFRGGVLHFAERRGLAAVRDRLQELAAGGSIRFAPADGIERRVREDKGFFA